MALPNLPDPVRLALLGVLSSLDQNTMQVHSVAALGEDVSAYGSLADSTPVLATRFVVWIAPQRSQLRQFIDHICAQYPARTEIPILQEHSERLGQIIALPAADPLQAYLIDSVVMVDRAQLRSMLGDLVQGSVRPVVTVSGPRQSGRSHSWHLIRHVAKEFSIPAHRVDLHSWVVEQRTLGRLFERLVADLGLNGVVPPTTEGAQPETVGLRYAGEVSDSLARRGSGAHHWIVFDSIDRPMANDIAAFVRGLCALRLESAFQDCTLFLLGDSTQVATPEGALGFKETLGRFLPTEIAQAATAVNALGAEPLPAHELATRLDELQAELDTCDPGSCCALVSKRLTTLRQEVRAP